MIGRGRAVFALLRRAKGEELRLEVTATRCRDAADAFRRSLIKIQIALRRRMA